MSVHSRPSIQYQDGMELRDRKVTKDCTQPLRIGNIRALNGCAGRLFEAATLHNHKNSINLHLVYSAKRLTYHTPETNQVLPARLAICSPCFLSICNIYLFPALVLRAGFAF